MELKLIDDKGQVSGSVAASDALFAREYNEALVHQLVTAFLANARSGNRAQLTRAEVKHSTKKPWRQKGTGRARGLVPPDRSTVDAPFRASPPARPGERCAADRHRGRRSVGGVLVQPAALERDRGA